MSIPVAGAKPNIKLNFDLGGLANQDFGHLFHSFEFKAMINGGYIVRAKLFDPHFNLLSKLTEEGYFRATREQPVRITFQILWNANARVPESATRPQMAILASLHAAGGAGDEARLEFVALDPPSWFLNMGDASGGVYVGRVDQVVTQVINQYAPGIAADVGRTTDSEHNRWWMMRQDPKTFISSLVDWSSSITKSRTQWLIACDGDDLVIKEQAEIPSRQRAFYRFIDDNTHDTIKEWEFLADNALSIVQAKLVTQGVSIISGQYLDRITDNGESKVFVKDSNTSNKQIAKIKPDQGFTKPPDAKPPQVGWSSVMAIPEVYSAGDLGLRYDDYVDGRPRGMWLNLVNALMRVKFTVIGHGEWSDGHGLGTDTIFVRWTQARPAGSSDKYWWMTGNWLVYGYHHRVTRGTWVTDLYCARYDRDAEAKKVGGQSQ